MKERKTFSTSRNCGYTTNEMELSVVNLQQKFLENTNLNERKPINETQLNMAMEASSQDIVLE